MRCRLSFASDSLLSYAANAACPPVELVQELLQRGLFVTFVAGWLADRAFEAGVDDSITLLAPLGPVYLTDFCRYAGSTDVDACTTVLLSIGCCQVLMMQAFPFHWQCHSSRMSRVCALMSSTVCVPLQHLFCSWLVPAGGWLPS
jgi:hypothetical protein